MSCIKIGDIVKCKVTGIENFGIFILTDNGQAGLIHISEISDFFVKSVLDYAQLDDIVYAKVIGFSDDNSRLKLSIKNIDYRNNGDDLKKQVDFSGLAKQLPIWIEEYEKSE